MVFPCFKSTACFLIGEVNVVHLELDCFLHCCSLIALFVQAFISVLLLTAFQSWLLLFSDLE